MLLPELARASQPMTYAVDTLVRAPHGGKFWEAKITRVDVDAGRNSLYTVRWEHEEFTGGTLQEQVEHRKVIGTCKLHDCVCATCSCNVRVCVAGPQVCLPSPALFPSKLQTAFLVFTLPPPPFP